MEAGMSDQFIGRGSQPAPYSQEAEEAVIGAVIIGPEMFVPVSAFLSADDFFLLRLRYVWQAFGRLAGRGDPIDYLTLCNELKAMGRLDEIGGPSYLTQLMNTVPTYVHAEDYGRIVERAAYRRRLLATSDQLKALALDENVSTDEIRASVEQKVREVNTPKDDTEDSTFAELVSEYYDTVESLMNGSRELTGISTGFRELDHLTLGLQNTDFILVAGRPGMGKSAWMLSATLNMAKAGRRVGWFSLEMPKKQLVQRAVSSEAGINLQALRGGDLSAEEWSRFVRTSGLLHKLPIHIDDRRNLTPGQVRAKCFQWMARHGKLDVVVVDYAQLMNGGSSFRGKDNRVAEISYISRELKGLARELNVPVLAAAQLSRAVEQRQDKRPVLSDLRESGQLEADADVVMFLYRDEVYNEATEFPNQADIIIAKHRNGPTGTISLYFEKTLTKFLNAAERSIDLSRI
jgi:replicative DNA helicase